MRVQFLQRRCPGAHSGTNSGADVTPTLIPTTTPTPIPTSTPTSVVPTPTLTVASSPTPTVAPTASSTPTRTPTSTPTAPPPPLTCVSGTAIGAGSELVLSLSGGNLVELAYSNGSASASGINFASSSELGKTWSTPVSVVDDGDNNVAPSIATDAAGDAWISWLDVTSGVVKVSATKDGKTFSPPVTIVSSGATLVMTPPYDSLALDRSTGNLYMATTGKSTGSNPILMRSTDLGLTWSAGATFTGDGSPSIAVGNPNNVFLTYNVTVTTPAGTAEQRNIALSTDGGTVFSNLGIIRTAAPSNSLEFTPGSLVLFPLSPSGNYAFGEFGAEAHPGTPGTLSSFVSSGVVSGAFPPVEETPIGFFLWYQRKRFLSDQRVLLCGRFALHRLRSGPAK